MLDFITSFFGESTIESITSLAKAGSDRMYSRVVTKNGSFVVCENKNFKENESFFYFSNYFLKHGIQVPELLAINESKTVYIQSDLGDETLLNAVLKHGHTEQVKLYYKKALASLANMQLSATQNIDYSQCFAAKQFDKALVLADLNYFKYYFLDLQKITYDRVALTKEFEQLSSELESISPQGFMFRDFQGRNIMLVNDEPFFIDYQGGMQGPIHYDVASLLWQAKAQLPADWRHEFLAYYKAEAKKYTSIDDELFNKNYASLVLVRLLQVLGAYGFRGLIEQRLHFLSSIPQGLQNIKEWMSFFSCGEFPTLTNILNQITQEQLIQKFTTQKATQATKLKILIQSFSYKVGIPTDVSGNGGGFVFDCRGVLNPGRYEEYKKLTGRDQSVKDFLETKTKINEFLNHAKQLVSISVDDYLARGFEHLMISFGCTGGQHRSVYCTDAMADFLKEKYNVNVEVFHVQQEAKCWVN